MLSISAVWAVSKHQSTRGQRSSFSPICHTTAEWSKTLTAGFQPCSAVSGKYSSAKQLWDFSKRQISLVTSDGVPCYKVSLLKERPTKLSHFKVSSFLMLECFKLSNKSLDKVFRYFSDKSCFRYTCCQDFKVVAENWSFTTAIH